MEVEKNYTLGFLIGRANYSMSNLLNYTLREEGIDLPHSQFVILKFLYDEDGISQHELAKRIFKDNAAVKRSLDNLQQKGLIRRIQVTPRKNSIVITDKAKKLMPRVFECMEKAMQLVLMGISQKEYFLLRDMLQRIYKNTQ